MCPFKPGRSLLAITFAWLLLFAPLLIAPTTGRAQELLANVGQAGDEKPRYNVLFIAVDDLRVELGCYGDTIAKTPHIDRLATQGTLFSRAYCQQAVCNPSRASMLTGLRPDTLRVWDLPTHFRQNNPDVVTLPQLFRLMGYHTRGIGKIFHNWRQDDRKGDAVSWSVPQVMHYGTHGADTPKLPKKVGKKLPASVVNTPQTECRDVPDDAYLDGRVASAAIKALRELKGQTFFLAVGFWKPHLPFNAPKRYWDLYDRSKISLPANPNPSRDVPKVALQDYNIRRDGKLLTREQVRDLRHGYYAAISYLDAQVGRVLDELDRLGLRDNTIIVFWSDHGLHLGEHGLWSKTTCFELDCRVPFILATPGHKGGQRSSSFVELLDIYPTLTDLCGLTPPKNLEGKSLRPILENPQATVKNFALTQNPRPPYPKGKMPQMMGYSLRTGDYRYTEWRDFKTGRIEARELYDHKNDAGEDINLARRAEYAQIVARLHRQLADVIERDKK